MAQEFEGVEIGATDEGVLVPAADATRSALARGLRRRTGLVGLLTDPGSFYGDLIDFVNDGFQAAIQAMSEGVAQTLFTSATGVFLRRIVAPLTTPLPATASIASLIVYGSPGVDVLAGSQVRVTQVSPVFETDAASGPLPAIGAGYVYVVEVADFDWQAEVGNTFELTVDGNLVTHVVGALDTAQTVLDDLRVKVNALALQQGAVGAGLNPGQSSRPGLVILDSLAAAFPIVFNYTGASPLEFLYSAAEVASTCAQTGATAANELALRRIVTPIAGWVGATNVDAALLGREAELDPSLRLRHRAPLLTPGGRNPDSIRSRVLLPVAQGGGGASFCVVEYNPYDVPDAAGNKRHSIRLVIAPTDDAQEACDAANLVKSGGDDTNGTLFVQVADKTGKLFPFFYDVLTYLYIWAEIEVEPGENWPQAGDPYAGIQADVAAFIEALGSADNRSGEDVRVSDLPIALYPPAQGGAPRGVSQWRVRLAATPTPAGPPVYGPWFPTDTDDQELASIAIGSREKARGSVARVTVSPL